MRKNGHELEQDPHNLPGYSDDGSGTLVKIAGCFIALTLLVVVGLIGSHFGHQRGLAEGFEQGVMKALTNVANPQQDIESKPSNGQQSTIDSARVACERHVRILQDMFADFRKTEAANRANARLLGLDEGMRIGREDWTSCGRWERSRLK